MSASNEKKTRKDQTGAAWLDPKTAREARQRKEEKRSDRLYALIAILFVIVAVVSITWKNNVIQKNATAATINGVNYSAAEVQYYYKNAYQTFVTNYNSYLSYFGLDTSKDLKDQTCNMSEDAGTWYDYFLKQGLQQMSSIHALCDAADKDGFTWTDDMQSQLDDSMDSLTTAAKNYNYTTDQYIRAIFGSIVSEKVYKDQLKLSILAQAYSDKYQKSLTYTTDDLNTAYTKDPNSFDEVDYQSVKVDGSVATTDASGNTVDVTDEMKTDAMAAAKSTANSIYADFKTGKSLSDLADANSDAKATYTDGQAGTYSDTPLMKWLFDSSRKAGDSTLIEDTDGSAYYVVSFSKRYRYEYNTVNVRQILIKPEETTLKEGDDGYDADVAAKKADAKSKAEDLLSQWKSGDATEDSFAELANKNSDDTGSNTNGGLYSQVYKGQMVTNFNDWCFDASRKTGDTGVVESDYGYHVLYFVGTDLPYWQVQVTNSLKSNDYNEWYTGLTKDYDATQHSFGMKFVG